MPSMPSLQRRRTITSVCCCMVAMASLWARMVGKSTRIASTDVMDTGELILLHTFQVERDRPSIELDRLLVQDRVCLVRYSGGMDGAQALALFPGGSQRNELHPRGR